MLLRSRGPGALSISKELKTLGPSTPFSGLLQTPNVPFPNLSPHPSHYTHCHPSRNPRLDPEHLGPYVAPHHQRPFPRPVVPRTSAIPSPHPFLGKQGLSTYPEVGPGSRQGRVSAGPGDSARRGRCCPGTPPRGPGGRRGPVPGARRTPRGRGAGRGGATREAHGGIARHRAGHLRSARLRCRLRSRHGSQPPPGAKPKPRLAGGKEGGGAWWGRGLGRAGGAIERGGAGGAGPMVVGGA